MARNENPILSEDEKNILIEKSREYFRDERDEEIGNMEALFILDFYIKELGPVISSKAIRRFKERMEISLEDTEVDVMMNLNFEK